MTGCSLVNFNTKEAYIEDFEVFILDIKEKYHDFDEDEWIQTEEAFEHFSKVRYAEFRDELTIKEYEKVDELIGQYKAMKMKSNISNFGSWLGRTVNQISSGVKELAD